MKTIAEEGLKKTDFFNGVRVLLAEDSKINQQIALELLEQMAAVVEVANNGQEAIDLLEKKPFDVVLMDLQMPVLDGYQTTAIIRQNPRYNNLPIIAMTADAGATDRDKCISMGMNDHVVKSLEPEYLFQSLSKWVKTSSDESSLLVTQISDVDNSFNNVETPLNGVDLSIGLKSVSGNRKLLKKLLQEFVQDHGNDIENIKSALIEKDIQKARRIAHTLQGISASLGFQAVFPIALALENALKNEELVFCNDLIEALDTPLYQVIDSITSVLQATQREHKEVKESTIFDKEKYLVLIDEVAQLIDEMSPDSEVKAEEIWQIMTEDKEKALAQLLINQLAEFDFDAAQHTLSKLTNAFVA
jgi:CheY-like chemotaxis protein